jgi:hypothetical protein
VVLYDEQPGGGGRAVRHQDAARALHDAGAPLERVAGQLLPALPMLDDWAVDWLVQAAPVLTDQAPPVAAELLDAAVRNSAAGDSRCIVLTAQLAEALVRLGRVVEAAELAERILPDVDDLDLRTSLHLTLARCRHDLAQYETGLAELESAIAVPDLTPRQRGLLGSRIGMFHLYLGQLDAAEKQRGTPCPRSVRAWIRRSRALPCTRWLLPGPGPVTSRQRWN